MMKQKKFPLSTLAFWLLSFSVFAQVEVKDGGKVGVIVTGQGNTMNVTQIFGKSPEYAELMKRLTRLDTLIQRKIVQCGKLQVANIEDLFNDCQKELGDLNIERDSIAKIEKQFKEDVQRLAETFSKININSERLRKAQALFDEGRIREVQFVMNDKEMAAEGDALLKEKERLKRSTQRTDSLLEVKAEEYRIKAQTKALDYTDPLRIDSTAFCYRQSLRYVDAARTLLDFAEFFKENNLYDSAFLYYPKIIEHPQSEEWQKANAYGHLSELYMLIGDLDKAIVFSMKAYELYTSLIKNNPKNTLYKQNLAISYSRLGDIHTSMGNLDKVLEFYEEYNRLEKELNTTNPNNVDFKNGLANSYAKLGSTHTAMGNLDKALGFYEKANQIIKELNDANPNNVDFKNGLAISICFLGITHTKLGHLDKALSFHEERNRLSKELNATNPNNLDFKNSLAISYCFLGITHTSLGNLGKALGFYEDYNRISKELNAANPNNVDFKNDLAISCQYLGYTYTRLGHLGKALGFYEESNNLSKELYATNSNNVKFKNGLAISYSKLGETHTALGNLDKALVFYEDYNRLEKELYSAYPINVDFKLNLGWSNQFLGITHSLLGNLDKALLFYEDMNKVFKELNAAYPTNLEFKNGLAISYYKLGAFGRDNLKDKIKALAYFKQAEVLWKELVRDASQHMQFQKFLGVVQGDLKSLD